MSPSRHSFSSQSSRAPAVPVKQIFPEEMTVVTADVLKMSKYSSRLKQIIDELGVLSAIAQNLKYPITTYDKILDSNHKLYLAVNHDDNDESEVIGFLKLGEKRLFVTDGSVPAWPANMQCVLDFYIKDQYQRHGWGKHIFQYALHIENVEPKNMAYDRPSEKLINFLAKHYNLKDVVEQPNRYVIYSVFFNNLSVKFSQGRCLPNTEINSSPSFLLRRY